LNGAQLVSTSESTPGGISPVQFKSHKHLVSIPVHVVKSGYDENRLTKPNHSTALLNKDRQGELLNKTPTYKDTFQHNLSI
jgi:hypothetical protein